jgi:enoyl-CoA hydratase/carnithine racemase
MLYAIPCALMYTSRCVEAEQVYRNRFLDRLVPADALLEEAMALARSMVPWPLLAMPAPQWALQLSTWATASASALQRRRGEACVDGTVVGGSVVSGECLGMRQRCGAT